MVFSPKQLIAVMVVSFALHSLTTARAANPYHVICERNIFHLRPPPQPVVKSIPTELPKVRLTGITTILRGKRALLEVQFPSKPNERAKEESFILKEGQRQGPIEVLEINDKLAQVKLNNSGSVSTITFDKIQPKASPTPIVPSRSLPWRNFTYGAVRR